MMLTTHEKRQLRETIQSNQHEIFIVSVEEMDAIVKSSPNGQTPQVQDLWQGVRDALGLGASYYASADDVVTLSKLVSDLGGIGVRAYVKTYGGKPHIILKGHPGLRKVLTGTKYGTKNPKVITMGLGKAGAINAAKSGGIVSIVLLTAFRVTDYFLTDQATLTQLVGHLATDIVKVGIASAASIGVVSGLTAVGFTMAIGPIAAVVVIGIGVSLALTALDDKYKITDRVVAALDELGSDTRAYIKRTRRNINHAVDRSVDSMIDYAIESATKLIIDFARHQLDEMLSNRPRLY